MERRYFELERGYLNIDDEALYFTRSGNWQDAVGTVERSRGQAPARWLRTGIGVVLVVAGGLFGSMGRPSAEPGSLVLTIGLLGLGILHFHQAMRHDFAPEFRIPFGKVRGVSRMEDGRHAIRFVNGDWKEDIINVRVPEEAAALILERTAR